MQEFHTYWAEISFGVLCVVGFVKWTSTVDKKLELLTQRLDYMAKDISDLKDRLKESHDHER